jgi:hypothetical protein
VILLLFGRRTREERGPWAVVIGRPRYAAALTGTTHYTAPVAMASRVRATVIQGDTG